MSIQGTEKYSLLRNNDGDSDVEGERVVTTIDTEEPFEASFRHQPKSRWTRARHAYSPSLVLIFSIATNLIMGVVLTLILFRQGEVLKTVLHPQDYGYTDKSQYAKLSDDPDFRFPYSVGYGPEITNHTLADIRWESIDIDAGIVALDQDWATKHNLVTSQPFPWDQSKGVYTINAFHTLHCLKNLHRIVYDAHHGRPLSRDVGHAMHCIDHMRKDAMCNADDFLLPTPPEKYGMAGPRGQSRVCRNWDQLVKWADQHNACYQQITDDEEGFAKERKEIERYANCPPDSPYRVRMEKYFADRGMDLDDIAKKFEPL